MMKKSIEDGRGNSGITVEDRGSLFEGFIRGLASYWLDRILAAHAKATKDTALKERIYRGEWEQIQSAKAEAERLERERLERQRLEWERQRQERELEWQRLADLAAEKERKKQLDREERWTRFEARLQKLFLYGSGSLLCVLIALLFWIPNRLSTGSRMEADYLRSPCHTGVCSAGAWT
jgi:hypothetical protein